MKQLEISRDELQKMDTDQLQALLREEGFVMAQDVKKGAQVMVPINTGLVQNSGIYTKNNGTVVVFHQD